MIHFPRKDSSELLIASDLEMSPGAVAAVCRYTAQQVLLLYVIWVGL